MVKSINNIIVDFRTTVANIIAVNPDSVEKLEGNMEVIAKGIKRIEKKLKEIPDLDKLLMEYEKDKMKS